MKDLVFLYELLKILQSIDVELKNLISLSFLQQFPYGTLLILILEIQLPSNFNFITHLIMINGLIFHFRKKASVFRTRLRLGNCALNGYLYSTNCCNSPLCVCGSERESVKHYLLSCPRFVAQRTNLLTSAAQVCGQLMTVHLRFPTIYCPNLLFI